MASCSSVAQTAPSGDTAIVRSRAGVAAITCHRPWLMRTRLLPAIPTPCRAGQAEGAVAIGPALGAARAARAHQRRLALAVVAALMAAGRARGARRRCDRLGAGRARAADGDDQPEGEPGDQDEDGAPTARMHGA